MKYYKIPLIILSFTLITSCAWFGNDTLSSSQAQYMIPAPPQKMSSSDVAKIENQLGEIESNAKTNKPTAPADSVSSQRIQEDRNSGAVTEIKVQNRGNLPDYYIYPSKQQNLNINNQNVSTPTWQINW